MIRGMKRFFKAIAKPQKDAARPQTRAFAPSEIVARGGACRNAWALEFDIPAWGFRKGEQVRVFPDAPVYLGDIVALRSDEGLKLARYRDEYMGLVVGLAVRV